jgi:hypothetical protein
MTKWQFEIMVKYNHKLVFIGSIELCIDLLHVGLSGGSGGFFS